MAIMTGWQPSVIGLAFDGTGYGDDARFWGGEFLMQISLATSALITWTIFLSRVECRDLNGPRVPPWLCYEVGIGLG